MNELVATRPRMAWQPTLAAVALLVIGVLWLYQDTARRMVALWGEAETFAHGFMVPVIVLWLLWRKRKALAAMAPAFAPSAAALFGVAAAAAVWLVGDVSAVNPASQFALVAMLVLTFPVLAGWSATRVILFPLCFLFFAVPFGDFLLPTLMTWTADFTVMALRATGVPVYRDGLQFVIPSGTWSVVEACSGVRYLLASLMVGALFAYLNYRSPKRRFLFMLVAIAVPILANWLRAYLIVMIGHLSSNTLAVGVDHLVYGWVFFGVVIAIMFMIGARWFEHPADEAILAPAPMLPGSRRPRSLWGAAAAMAVLLAAPLLVVKVLTATEDRSVPLLTEPALAGVAPAGDSGLAAWTPAFVNPSATLERRYAVRGQGVGLYIGYYRDQGPARKLVSSTNALVRSNDGRWTANRSESRSVVVGERSIPVKTVRLRQRTGMADAPALIAWQLYWIDGRFEANDAKAKVRGAWQRLRGAGDDGAVIVLYAMEQRPGDADALLEGFLRDHLGAVETQLRKTRYGD